jgi:hypothetical protein
MDLGGITTKVLLRVDRGTQPSTAVGPSYPLSYPRRHRSRPYDSIRRWWGALGLFFPFFIAPTSSLIPRYGLPASDEHTSPACCGGMGVRVWSCIVVSTDLLRPWSQTYIELPQRPSNHTDDSKFVLVWLVEAETRSRPTRDVFS